ncbi:MAG: HD domain-containing protein [Haliangiales bacterium]
MGLGLPGRPKVFRDPVHGDIGFTSGPFQQLVCALVNTELFQRLRNIRQNGVCNLVFHGAEHSRFCHSMGVAHVAGRMFDAAARNSQVDTSQEEREATVLAALLHDVGHGPYSHLIEEALGRDVFDHERMTVRIITEKDSAVHTLLEAYRPGLSAELVPFIDKRARTTPRWFHSIVSSQLDADRLDYLARDAQMAGVLSHHFDAERLISFLGVVDNELVVDARARDVLENYLLALDQMYAAVYYHHTVRCASQMLTAILKRAVVVARADSDVRAVLFPAGPDGEDPLWALAVHGHQIALDRYQDLDEVHVGYLLRGFRRAPDPTLKVLCDRFATRRFPKHVDLQPNAFHDAMVLEKRAGRLCRERHPDLDVDYLVAVDDASRLSYKRYRPADGVTGSIKILGRDGRVRPIEEHERTVVKVLEKKAFYNRLIVPADTRDELMRGES